MMFEVLVSGKDYSFPFSVFFYQLCEAKSFSEVMLSSGAHVEIRKYSYVEV